MASERRASFERIAALAELARLAWPHEQTSIFYDGIEATVMDMRLSECRQPDPLTDHFLRIVPQRASQGPRALDALEAALRVLAGRS